MLNRPTLRAPCFVALVLCGLAAALLAVVFAGVTPIARAEDELQTYLPLVIYQVPRPVIEGAITLHGQPLADAEVKLWASALADPIAITVTDAQGVYRFADVRPLPAGASHRVTHHARTEREAEGYPSETRCESAGIEGLEDGKSYRVADFDITPVRLLDPVDGATVSLPRTFRWEPRPGRPNDNYLFAFVVPGSDSDWVADNLGSAGSLRVTAADIGSLIAHHNHLRWRVFDANSTRPCISYQDFDVYIDD